MERPNTKTATAHVHGQPFEDEMAPFWDSDAPQQEVIHYFLYEESVDYEVDLDTGQTRILGFAGKKLTEPTEWR